jgi:hypothetical protein
MARMRVTNKSGTNPPTQIPAPRELVRPHVDPAELERLLEEWMQGDPVEQRETFEALKLSLDEDRPAGYKLFS